MLTARVIHVAMVVDDKIICNYLLLVVDDKMIHDHLLLAVVDDEMW